jgi:DNA invertase Pin-like site-specific DNA recombinase
MPMGRAMFTTIAAMAEIERSVIWERVISGLDYARVQWHEAGRPVGRPRLVFNRDEVVIRKEKGYSWSQIAKELKISSGSARRAYLGCSSFEQPTSALGQTGSRTRGGRLAGIA